MVMLSTSSLLKERFGHPNINPSPPLLKVVEEVWSSDNTTGSSQVQSLFIIYLSLNKHF